MQKIVIFCAGLLCLMADAAVFAQTGDPSQAQAVSSWQPGKFLQDVDQKTSSLDGALTRQTRKYLKKLAGREAKMQRALYKLDSAAAEQLFGGVQQQYAAFDQKMVSDTGVHASHTGNGDYYPYVDSLQNSLKYLGQQSPGSNTNAVGGNMPPGIQQSISNLQTLQNKMEDADALKEYVRERKQVISNYISQHSNLAGSLGTQYEAMNKDLYYYSQQVRGLKAMLNDPDRIMKEALGVLNKVPAFQDFMHQHSQLASLFNLPSNYGSVEGLAGLQTRDQVAALIGDRISSAGPAGPGALQSSLQSAQGQLGDYKDKLNQMGSGSGDIDMPNFKPNEQKTKTFWRRLEYGLNFQTTSASNYFPTTSDLGVSVGYKIWNGNSIGAGASYKIGLGNGFNHIAITSQGAGFRSFIDIRIRGSFSATGGFEYNYNTPFQHLRQLRDMDNWTKSGLIGVSKTVSVKSRVFKKTRVQLLWDFLSYQQTPKTQAFLFRIGYSF